jgi:ribosomal protein S12 methylthiotransferase
MKIHLASLGCARNQIDSEVMLGRLKRTGAVLTDTPADAEVIVVNTCSFIESAADESIDTILELAKFKQEGQCRRLVVTGCLPERYREDIAEAIPEVDVFLGTGAFDRIVEAVDGYLDTSKCLLPDPDAISTSMPDPETRIRTSGPMAYLKTAEGCNRRCTYCIIPKLRGRQKSRPLENILAEARRLIQIGIRELVLVSQETTAYGKDLSPAIHFASLLEALAGLGDEPMAGRRADMGSRRFWVRFLYGHPESLDRRTMVAVARHAHICSYIDVPIQHASGSVLKRMGRRYGSDQLYAMVDQIRREIPDVALRTTVIVGFPGETDAEFNALIDFIESAKFDHLGCFVYSDADDLPSHRLSNHVPAATARERYRVLMKRQQDISTARNRRFLNQVLTVLVEEQPEKGLYTGRTEFQAPEVDGITYIHSDSLATGSFAQVRITDTLEYDLVGVAI